MSSTKDKKQANSRERGFRFCRYGMRLEPIPGLRRLLSVASTVLLAAFVHAGEWRLTVAAGDFDRQDAVVEFQAPEGLRGNFTLHDAANSVGRPAALQIDAAGRGVFIEHSLSKGMQKTYSVVAAPEISAGIVATKRGQTLEFTRSHAGQSNVPMFTYQMEPGPVPAGVAEVFRHGAHLHPIFSPGSRIVTGNHPPDHRWHRGVWLGWTDTDFEGRHPDFWNLGKEPTGLTGEVRFASLDSSFGGPVQGGFGSQHRFIDHTGGSEKEVLAESWTVHATALPSAYAIDLVSTQNAIGGSPLKLPKYYYGGLGVRGPSGWDPPDKVSMVTSNGDDRLKGDNSHAKWVAMHGEVDGQQAGMAVLIHPANFRFPQPLRLNPKNPQLCVAPSQDGDWEIAPGKPYVSRYRLLVFDGEPDSKMIERAWNDYANPAVARLSRE